MSDRLTGDRLTIEKGKLNFNTSEGCIFEGSESDLLEVFQSISETPPLNVVDRKHVRVL